MFRRSPLPRFLGGVFGSSSSSSSSASSTSAPSYKVKSANTSSSSTATATSTTTNEGTTMSSSATSTAKYSSAMEALSENAWSSAANTLNIQHLEEESTKPSKSTDDPRRPKIRRPGDVDVDETENENITSSLATEKDSKNVPTTSTTATKNKIQTNWMVGAEHASIGEEFKGVDSKHFLKRVPEGYLTHRAVMDVQPAEELLEDYIGAISETYKGIDVRDPNTVTGLETEKPKWLTMGGKVRAVSEFISGHVAHQVSLPVWMDVFDLKHMEMDLMYWLWILHFHIIARRATSVKIDLWSRRREVLDELALTMYRSWEFTAEEVMGRPPLSRIRHYIKDMYYVTAINLEEALMHDGCGGDLMLLGCLVKFCPLPRPEDIPLYTYYTLVHYIRFHIALFDRISDEEFSKGNFNFFSPDDPAIFKSYSDCSFDEVVRDWKAQGAAKTEADDEAAEKNAADDEKTNKNKNENENGENEKQS